jgi:hypothetical protein
VNVQEVKAKAALAEAEQTVAVLEKLLAEAKQRLEVALYGRQTSMVGYGRQTYLLTSPVNHNAPKETLVLEESIKEESIKEDPRTDEEMKLDHRSGSSENSAKCRAEFLKWLGDHDVPGQWLETKKMCVDLDSWPRFSKRVVDPVLEQLVSEGLVEVYRNYIGWPFRICLKAQPSAKKPDSHGLGAVSAINITPGKG